MGRRALVTGASGFVGGRLAVLLADSGWVVRCVVRDRSRAPDLAERGLEVQEADVLDATVDSTCLRRRRVGILVS
jgi:uncharacterized protein YbjT (DUF2867 family)